MTLDQQVYDQPIKTDVRERVLRHAVDALTKGRQESPVVTSEQFSRMADYCQRFVKKVTGRDLAPRFDCETQEWMSLHRGRVGEKSANELHALILCGPDPLNDFRVLMDLGISPENVWAIEGDTQAFRIASQKLREAALPVKLHNGSLRDFFAVIPQQFDLVYFDGCGPLFGGKPNTIHVLHELFLNQRLSPLSVLITNFSVANKDGTNASMWSKRFAVWYAPRYIEPAQWQKEIYERMVEPELYYAHIEENLEAYYSDFISRFTIEFASQLLPWWRVVALPAARREYFASPDKLKASIDASLGITDHLFSFGRDTDELDSSTILNRLVGGIFEGYGLAVVSSELYPHLWIAQRTDSILDGNDPMRILFHKERLLSTSLAEAIRAVSLIQMYDTTRKNDRDACSPGLAKILDNFRWFDSPGERWCRMFCDTPYPNLIVDLLVGLYGYPYHANMEKHLRLEYTAKSTPMFTDVFVFDQARYLYDIVPTLSLFDLNQSVPAQLVFRICMNAIRRHAYSSCTTLYQACSLGCTDEEGFSFCDMPNRLKLTA